MTGVATRGRGPLLDQARTWSSRRRNRRALDFAREPLPRAATPTATSVDATRGNAAGRTRRQRVALGGLVGAVAMVGVFFIGPFPVRTWWAQRQRTQALQHQIDVVDAANTKLAARADDLRDPATVARLARQNYGMVRPGDRAYALLPSPKVPVVLPGIWPFVQVVAAPGAAAPTATSVP